MHELKLPTIRGKSGPALGGTEYRLMPSACRLISHLYTFNGPLSEITRVSRYQKGKTNLDFNGARDSEWQWHQLGHMQVCTSLQTDNHASTPPLCFFTGRMPFLPPNQQRQSTEGTICMIAVYNINYICIGGYAVRCVDVRACVCVFVWLLGDCASVVAPAVNQAASLAGVHR